MACAQARISYNTKMARMQENQIIQGDCLEVMKDWPDNYIDLVVTSPPYGEIRSYNGTRVDCRDLSVGLYRVLKDGAVCVWITKDQTVKGDESGESFRQALSFKSIGFYLHDTMIYAKTGVNYPNPARYHDSFEYMFVFSKGKPKTINLIRDWKNNTAGDRSSGRCRQYDDSQRLRSETFENSISDVGIRQNIWVYNTGFNHSTKDAIAFEHPAIFPELLVADHIRSWSNKGDLVLDPMNGSGTTTKMAAILKRRYLGIDISEKYCEIARMRLKEVDTGVPVKEQLKGQQGLFE